MQSLDIPIIVVAYNRPASLLRLLESIEVANFDGFSDVQLLISIDNGGDPAVQKIAHGFEWKYGEKQVVYQPNSLGLKRHILQCGNLSQMHDGVIILEDDLVVSPVFYDFAQQAATFYKDDPTTSGISLYSYAVNEFAKLPFESLSDGYDNYFLQSATSWGQLWTKNQWQRFSEWYATGPQLQDFFGRLPSDILRWPDRSWKKFFHAFLVDSDTYFVVPRVSHTSNCGDRGSNFLITTQEFRVPLAQEPRTYRFSRLTDSNSRYDAFFEIAPEILQELNPELANYSFVVDIYGTKTTEALETPYVCTARDVRNPIMSFPITGPNVAEAVALNRQPHSRRRDISLVATGDAKPMSLWRKLRLDHIMGKPQGVLIQTASWLFRKFR